MTFTTPLLKRDNCFDLKSTMLMLQLQRTTPGTVYILKEKADTKFDYLNVASSLCGDSDLILGKLLDKMHDDGFGMLSDTVISKTHPKELFLKVGWNLCDEGNLNKLDLVRPYHCAVWNDLKESNCVTDVICFAFLEDTKITEQVHVFRITFCVPESQERCRSQLWQFIKQVQKSKEREGCRVIFDGKKMDEEFGFVTIRVKIKS